MAFTQTLSISWSGAGADGATGTISESGDGQDFFDVAAADSADQEVSLAFVKANLKLFYVISDKVVTLKTNVLGAPVDTIVLVANVPWFWASTGGLINPFVGDVTKFFVTNASGATANLKFRVLRDVTP